MNKMMLIIDDPEMCGRCPLVVGTGSIFKPKCSRTNRGVRKYWSKGKPKWCPLVEKPDYIEVENLEWEDGWNACVESLEKKK